jgi:hypothetical protein
MGENGWMSAKQPIFMVLGWWFGLLDGWVVVRITVWRAR